MAPNRDGGTLASELLRPRSLVVLVPDRPPMTSMLACLRANAHHLGPMGDGESELLGPNGGCRNDFFSRPLSCARHCDASVMQPAHLTRRNPRGRRRRRPFGLSFHQGSLLFWSCQIICIMIFGGRRRRRQSGEHAAAGKWRRLWQCRDRHVWNRFFRLGLCKIHVWCVICKPFHCLMQSFRGRHQSHHFVFVFHPCKTRRPFLQTFDGSFHFSLHLSACLCLHVLRCCGRVQTHILRDGQDASRNRVERQGDLWRRVWTPLRHAMA